MSLERPTPTNPSMLSSGGALPRLTCWSAACPLERPTPTNLSMLSSGGAFPTKWMVEIAVTLSSAQFNKGAQVLVDATEAVIPQAGSSTLYLCYVILLYSCWLSSTGPHEFIICIVNKFTHR